MKSSELKNVPWEAKKFSEERTDWWYVINANGDIIVDKTDEYTAKAIAELPDTLKRLEELEELEVEYELNKEGLARVCAENQELKKRLEELEAAAQAILNNWFHGDGITRVADLMQTLKTTLENETISY